MVGGAGFMHLTRSAEIEKQSLSHDTKCQSRGHQAASRLSETATVLIPFQYAQQLCAELQWSAVVQHVCLLGFADRIADALSAGGHVCASGFRATTSFQSCLTAAWSPPAH